MKGGRDDKLTGCKIQNSNVQCAVHLPTNHKKLDEMGSSQPELFDCQIHQFKTGDNCGDSWSFRISTGK